MIHVSLTPRNGSGAQRSSIEFHGAYQLQPDGRIRIFDVHPGREHLQFTVLNPPGFVSLEVVEAIACCVIRGEMHGATGDYEWVATLP